MKIAVEEHLKCVEFPRVGVVVAKAGEILSTGFRGEVPKTHAERVALEKLTKADRAGSTVYTTLEPCVVLTEDQAVESCADLIIASGVSEVVVGVLDRCSSNNLLLARKSYNHGANVLLKYNDNYFLVHDLGTKCLIFRSSCIHWLGINGHFSLGYFFLS
jgi:pyrimidine deaminase RibD-like protein